MSMKFGRNWSLPLIFWSLTKPSALKSEIFVSSWMNAIIEKNTITDSLW